MQAELFQAALAGLLHDIGKFAQRAGELGSRIWDDEAKKDYKYQHALYSGDFVEKYVPKQWAKGLSGPAHHHNPQTDHDYVVAVADRLSTGQPDDDGDKQPGQLLSIFCEVSPPDGNGGQIDPPTEQYLPLASLRVQQDPVEEAPPIFPQAAQPETGQAYKTLWDQFTRQVMALKEIQSKGKADEVTYLNNLLKLMQRYVWAIPSAYFEGRANVGLYDHSRMTGALAACLAKRGPDEVKAMWAQPDRSTPVALLVGGDISGVQDFIYTITSRGATSGLRGRSMYLQLLTEVVARYVLDRLELPLTNLIYAGGGHFYLLAPTDCETRLGEVRQQVSRILLHHHQGDLYLALAQMTLQANQFHGPALSEQWRGLTQRLQEAKQRQFAELEAGELKQLFQPQEHGGNQEKFCAVCQREHPGTRQEKEETAAKCPACRSFEKLGEELRRARYLCLTQKKPAGLVAGKGSGAYQQVLSHFGYEAEFYREPAKVPNLSDGMLRRTLLALDDAGLAQLQPAARQAVGRHLLVNVTPTLTQAEYEQYKDKVEEPLWPNSVKPFEIMARQATGIKRLGILRMDVDNLGQIFSKGLGEKANLSRIATLSFAMSLFFEGWLAQIAEQLHQADQPELVYSIYSGGDDLFFVGAWHLMPKLAEAIQKDLTRYTGGHPGIHVSGGIALIPSKYPLYQAADDAYEAEKAAKANVYNGQKKDALNFIGKTIPWAKFATVKTYYQRLIDLVEPEDEDKKAVPHNLVQRLSQLYLEYEQAMQAQAEKGEASRVYWGRGQWYGTYSLSRMAQQHEHAKAEISALRDDLKLENFTNIEWMGPAARWVELLIRKSE